MRGIELQVLLTWVCRKCQPGTVEQAVMRLELSGANMLMFRNASHFGLNVVQMRDDGSIGWIDPRGSRRLANSV